MTEPIRTLFITLKRSFAGTRDTHKRILESLGLRYRQQTVERANMGSIRGAIGKASGEPVCDALHQQLYHSRLSPFASELAGLLN